MVERDIIRVSEEEYLDKYAADFYEWIDGELIALSPVSYEHDALQDYLRDWVKIYFQLNPIGRIVGSPFVMRLPHKPGWREPDLQVILNTNLAQFTDTGMHGAADICIEIVSPESVERDYADKVKDYQDAGVREYWLFDLIRKQSRFHRLNETGTYSIILPDTDGTYTTPLLPRFKLPVTTLWEEDKPDVAAILDAVRAMLADDSST